MIECIPNLRLWIALGPFWPAVRGYNLSVVGDDLLFSGFSQHVDLTPLLCRHLLSAG